MATARSSIKLSFLTIVSRVLGLLRDSFQAHFFGTGVYAAIWEVAYLLPNMLRNLLAEGVLSQAFQPIYSAELKKSKEKAREAAGVIFGMLFLFLLGFVLLGILLFPWVLPVYAGRGGAEASLLVLVAQIMFVFILTASLTAILAGISNAHLWFTWPALSPILLNIVFILSFLALTHETLAARSQADQLIFLSVAVVLGGCLQFLLQAWHIYHKGLFPRVDFAPRHPAVKKILSLMAPAALGAGMFQLGQLTDIFLAGYLIDPAKDPIPTLRFAQRLIQLPTGIVGVAVATVILPALLRLLREDPAQTEEELMRGLSFAAFLTLPACLGLFFLRTSIVDLLFSGGAWTGESTRLTAYTLAFYAPGVIFFSWNRILTSSFFAYEDTRTPVKIMVRVMAVNVLLNLILIPRLDQGGLALSSSLSALLNSILLLKGLGQKMAVHFRLLVSHLRELTVPVICLGIYLLVVAYFGAELADLGGEIFSFLPLNAERERALMVVLTGAGGGLILYLGLAHLLKIRPWKALFQRS